MVGANNHEHDQPPPGDSSSHSADSASEMTLNYAFAPPSGGNLNPLPLTISKKLLEGPSAALRPIIIDTLGAEEIVVRLGEIRFWRTKIPLESRIAANSIRNWIEQLPFGEQVSEVIPFTEPISECLCEWASNKRLVHFIVTGGDTPFYVEPESFSSESSLTGPPQPSTPTIVFGQYDLGYYPGRKDWSEVKEGERHSKDIDLVLNGCSSSSELGNTGDTTALIPSVLLGIKRFCAVAPNHEVQIMAHVSDIHPKGFRVHLDAFGRTMLYNGRLDWMAIPLYQPRPLYDGDTMQWGTVDSQSSHPRKVGRRSMTLRVPFRHPYQQTPTVFSCLSGFTIGGSASTHWDIRTFVTGIDREGFSLRIEKARDSEQDADNVLAHALVSWVSIPGGTRVGRVATCGEFHLEDGVRTEKDSGKTVQWKGKSKFLEKFSSPPQVFVAFKSFDFSKSQYARINVEIEKTTTEGIEWKVHTWCGTITYSASMAFFAVGDI